MKNNKITYAQVGDDYDTKDPIKKIAQSSASKTATNLNKHFFSELIGTRGESAYVFKNKNITLATVIEGLGTKNLVADAINSSKKSYYDVIGYDTVATIINDLVSVGATPLTIHAYWAVEDNSWFNNKKRFYDLVKGWKKACDISGVSWGGGETPTLKGIMQKDTCELGGSAVGVIKNKIITDRDLKDGDRIILLKSNGINANGLSLAREIAKNLPNGYATKVTDSQTYGEMLLKKTNIYADLISSLLDKKIEIHYISNITGHGLRKIMRSKRNFTYTIEKIFPKPLLFKFMQEQSGLSDEEAYGTWNMGQDYCLILPKKSVALALDTITKHNFQALDAGFITAGKRQVVLVQKNVTFSSETLDLKS